MSSYRNLSTPKGVVINNPHTGTLNVDMTTGGIWSQLKPGTGNTYHACTDPFEDNVVKLEKKLQTLELQYTLLKLKVLGMENKFTQEEVANIRKMIMSEDEASRTLADSIIENA
jgi:hypothetical protein